MGEHADGVKVDSYYDKDFGVRVVSLYSEVRAPPRELLKEVEAVIYDIQDLGLRWYTYISTLYYVVKASGDAGIPLYVFDRPNPLTGEYVEGPVLRLEYRSFVGIGEIPVRYGLTPAELALFFNEKYSLSAEIHVVKMEDWKRSNWFDETGLPWIPPSPNIPTFTTALVYAGFCILEGTNISEGRGTTKPFEYFGAPWINWKELLQYLKSAKLDGVAFRPVRFRPYASKYANTVCKGFQIYVLNRSKFRSLFIALKVVEAVMRIHPDNFEWRCHDSRCWFDFLLGTSEVRRRLDSGERVEDFYHKFEKEAREFKEKYSHIRLYS